MATEVAEALAQVDAQAEMVVQCGDLSCSGSDIPPPAVVGQENGVRVSAEGEEAMVVDMVTSSLKVEVSLSVETKVVETEIAAETDVETEIVAEKGVSESDALLVEKANIVEVSDSKHVRDVVENGDGPEEVKCSVDGDSEVLVGDDSDNRVELEPNEISLVVEFHGPPDCADKSVENGGEDGDKGSVAEDEKLTEPQGNEGSSMGENGEMPGDGHSKQKDTYDQEGDKGSVSENGGAEAMTLTEPQTTERKMGENGEMEGDGHTKQKDTCDRVGDDGSVAEDGGSEEEKLTETQGTEGKMGENVEMTGDGQKDTCDRVGDNGSVAEEDKLTEAQGNEGRMGETGEGKMGENGEMTGDGHNKQKDTCNREEGQGLGEEEDDSEDGESDEEHDYRIGDFVWGKIRSHPWWPGRIYDPSDASEYARRLSKTKGLLVAYFGDGSFSWCYPSQLKPFADDFDETSKQSNSKNFVNAVKEALDEIVTAVELKMVCSCVPEKDRTGLVKPSVRNAGIKPGVLVPECDLSRLTGLENESARIVAALKNVAESGRPTDTLEFAVLKGWLSAFCRAKGGYERAIYREPLYIEGLEDKNKDAATNLTDFSAPVEVPFQGPSEEDWLSSPLRGGGSGQSVLQRCLIAGDKLYHRRKKSVADLMNEEVAVEPKAKKGKVDATKDSTDNDLASQSGRKRGRKKAPSKSREKTVLSKENGGDEQTSSSRRKRGRKIAEFSETSSSEEDGTVSSENDSSDEETKREKVSSAEDDNKYVKEESKGVSSSRERKKSKYLSPPFTNPILVTRKTSSKKRHETESEKVRKAPRIGERMTKVAGQLFGSTTPSAQCSDENHVIVNPTSHPPEENHEIVDSVKNKSMKEVVSEVRAAALNPVVGLDSSDGKFIHAFRSSVYSNGSDYKKCLEDQEGEKGKSLSSKSEFPEADSEKNEEKRSGNRKRKSRSSKPELQVEDLNQTEPELLEPGTPKASNDNNELVQSSKRRTNRAGKASDEEKSGEGEQSKKKLRSRSSKPELLEKDLIQMEHVSDSKTGLVESGKKRAKQAGEASKAKKNAEDMRGEVSSPPTLVVAFPPAFTLPSKGDVIRIFSKFGPLNEKETNVFYNSFCARIVFLKASDAEEAYNTSAEKKLFGAAKVNYRLQYPPGASNANKETPPIKAKSPVKSVESSSHGSAADEVPTLLLVKEKLELMTSMLAKSGENITPELKSNLEGEMGGLLEKVSAAVKSSSS